VGRPAAAARGLGARVYVADACVPPVRRGLVARPAAVASWCARSAPPPPCQPIGAAACCGSLSCGRAGVLQPCAGGLDQCCLL